MKKIFFTLMLLILSLSLKAQEAAAPVTFFGQCMVQMSNEAEASAVEAQMRTNPNIRIVRLDFGAQRGFLLTQGIEQLTEAQFASWFLQYQDKLSCIQIGVDGVDERKPFPFTDCD
jgi:hypothetical protein